jgi:hypothetical protein
LCRKIGVQLKAQTYLLSNTIKQIVTYLNDQAAAASTTTSVQGKRKTQTAPSVTEQQVLESYKFLPF